MKLLVFTQKVDANDPVLGFFHGWLSAFALRAESVTVVCLEEGEYSLPKNVLVYSLGKNKTKNVSRMQYIKNFYSILRQISGTYDTVFVHMNQEYVLLGGLYWKWKKTPVLFWRNHRYGNILTRIAVALSTKVFCTSPESYTAQFANTRLMPAGIDTHLFAPVAGVVRKENSVCVVGRVAPVKRIELALDVVKSFVESGEPISLTIVGEALEKDISYYDSLVRYVSAHNLSEHVSFRGAVAPEGLPSVYSQFHICLNMTESGSFDKTIVESAACGAVPIVTNRSLSGILPAECMAQPDVPSIVQAITQAFDPRVQNDVAPKLADFVESQSLSALLEKLFS